ncbi:MAG: hypothetical protein IT430_10470 [Phycisphaerales bacterium]|nr:hypothetical protein [Phycisphaerales bacterium]
MNAPTTILLILLGFAGLAALLLGLRGRRVDDHPHCRRCRFDLFGLGAAAARCPECGADLAGPRAVVRGLRRRRPIIAALGAVLLLACSAWVALSASGTLSKVDWNHYKPAWWLAIEAQSADMAKSDAALRELVVRLGDKELSQRRIDGLVATATSLFDSPPAELSRHWDRFVTGAWAGGYLDDATAWQYAVKAFQPEVYLEAATLDGQPAGVVGARVVPARRFSSGFYVCELVELSVDGVSIELPPKRTIVESLDSQRPHLLSPAIDFSPHRPHCVEATVQWTLATHTADEFRSSSNPPGRLTYSQRCTFTEPAANPTVAPLVLLSDSQTRAAIVEATSIELYAARGHGRETPTMYMHLSLDNLPVAVDAAVRLESPDGRVVHSTHVKTHVRDTSETPYRGGTGFYYGAAGLMIPSVDIVLATGCLDYPEMSGPKVSPIRMWCGEIRWCDFPVQWVDRDTPLVADAIRANLGVPRTRPEPKAAGGR